MYKRQVYRRLEKNEGISGNSNEAIKMATGEYIALLDHDDLLMPQALYANVELLNKDRDYEFIYSDEDKLTEDGERRFDPFFKPDFSPDMLLAFNYITHFVVIKKSLLDEVGYFRKEFNGAQDYDLFLRLTEKAKKVGHISDILYHWRLSLGSTAYSSDAKSYTIEAGRSALEAAFLRRGLLGAHVANNTLDNYYITSYDIPQPHPLISIIIPNKDEKKTLKKCIDSILRKSTYDNFEIIIVENNSTGKEIFSYYETLKKNPKIRIVEWKYPFNYAALNNYAAAQDVYKRQRVGSISIKSELMSSSPPGFRSFSYFSKEGLFITSTQSASTTTGEPTSPSDTTTLQLAVPPRISGP